MLTVSSGLDETILITSTHTSGVGIGGEWGFGGGVGGGGLLFNQFRHPVI